jgi:zinc and cadmium transporter
MNFLFAILASVVVSLISLIGIFSLLLKDGLLNKAQLLLVGFGAGGLIGGAFLHLLPEALEASGNFTITFVYVIIGFIIFFILERYLHWRHCHDEKCNIHAFTYLSLIGDGVHNLLDGLIIGASFFAGIKIGMVATVAIILHEIPQELGDFGILIYGGFSRFKALMYNFISAATAIVGTLIGYAFASRVSNFTNWIIPIAAGGFIYIASCDLIPELHKQANIKKATFSMLFFLLGILLMLFLKLKLE